MSEFVKKTAVGYRNVKSGQSDPECTHVIMTLDEYKELLRKISRAEYNESEAKAEAAKQIQKAFSDVAWQAKQAENESQKKIDEMQERLDIEQREKEYQIGLNENLLRISRERANADRKLKPKKEHTGYVVVLSSEKEYKYKDGRWDWASVMLWETVMQSPYSIEFTEDQARTQIQDLFPGNVGTGVIERIGINIYCDEKYEDLIEKREWNMWQKYNVLLSWKLRANYRARYWEVILTHTKPLDSVPKDMRI